MKLYLQLGHGMQALSQDLIKSWGAGTAIISPVNMSQNKIAAYAKKYVTSGEKFCLILRCSTLKRGM